MSNEGKIILDLCGGTGAWSKPYKDAGYDVRIITLPEYDVRTYSVGENRIYGILAAPPCTDFCLAKAMSGMDKYNFRSGMDIVYHCLRIIWEAQYNGWLKFWALENPKGFLTYFLGRPAFYFQPYHFGDNYTKKTYLWGYFCKPVGKLGRPVKVLTMCEYLDSKGVERSRSARRAITPPGFANAFYLANR